MSGRFVSVVLSALQVGIGVAVIALTVAQPQAQAAPPVQAAAAGPNLEIAPAGTQAWAKEIGSAWVATNIAPGDLVTGSVRLRLTGLDDASQGLSLAVLGSRPPGPLERALLVTAVGLDGQSLLPAWNVCAAAGGLTLADLMTCQAVADVRPGAQGATFTMSIRLAAASTNLVQGSTTGGLRFEFRLGPLAVSAPGTPATGGPGSGAPQAGAAPSNEGAPGAPAGAVAPRPPNTGMGYFPDPPGADRRLVMIAGLAAAWLLVSILAAFHGRWRQRAKANS